MTRIDWGLVGGFMAIFLAVIGCLRELGAGRSKATEHHDLPRPFDTGPTGPR